MPPSLNKLLDALQMNGHNIHVMNESNNTTCQLQIGDYWTEQFILVTNINITADQPGDQLLGETASWVSTQYQSQANHPQQYY